jgi:DNA processing protein
MSDISQRQAIMTLCALSGLGPVRIGRLLEYFGGSAPDVLKAPLSSLCEVRDIGPETAATIVGWGGRFDYRKEEESLAGMGAKFVLKGEKGYPPKLAQVTGAPEGLYIRGIVPDMPTIAIVGTRRPTLYGRHQAKLFAEALARAGICIVSGLARGIDGEAHSGALEVEGQTVAFLGCGLDIVYPPEHAELYGKIVASGAIVSEFALGKQPDAQSFPQRNRLISGMADAVLVVESDVKGGSMITARFAGEQGRLIFAMPGRIDQPSSRGCHALIRDGATLVSSVDDILDEMRVQCPSLRIDKALKQPQGELQFPVELTDDERKVLSALSDGGVLNSDAIASACVISQQAAMAALLLLELKKLVARRADACYEIRRA